MKINKFLLKYCLILLAAVTVFGCSDQSEELDNRPHGYGYLQLKLYKQVDAEAAPASSRSNDPIDLLGDAAKIKISFVTENRNIEQTLLLTSSDTESAEFGLRSETVELLAGDYKIIGYVVYNKLDEAIAYGEPNGDEELISVTESKLTQHELYLDVVPRGKIQFSLTKDLADFTRTTTRDDAYSEYTFPQVDLFDIILMSADDPEVKLPMFEDLEGRINIEFDENNNQVATIDCDSVLSVKAGSYKIYRLILRTATTTLDILDFNNFSELTLEVEDNETLNANIPVKINANDEYIKDYIALKAIWEALDGPNWSWSGSGIQEGANWNFDKDVDMWGYQPGVTLLANGRVSSMNLGGFNPNPDRKEEFSTLPSQIGQLTEITQLFLGDHNQPAVEIGDGAYSQSNQDLNPFVRYISGDPVNKSDDSRMEYAKRRGAALHPSNPATISKIIMDVTTAEGTPYYVAPAPYAVTPNGYITNGIKTIDPAIGNLTKLETFFIANGLVEDLPSEMANLTSLTDFEIYNCSKMTKIPDVVADLPALVLINISMNEHMSSASLELGLESIFNGASKELIQIIYCTNNNLEAIPANISNLIRIGMLDFSANKLTTIPALGAAISPVELYFDNNLITKFEKVGGVFCNTDDLDKIVCTNNKLTELPNIFTSDTDYKITSVDFSENQISSIEESANYNGIFCETLNLSYNKLTDFPIEFTESDSKFTFINMDTNELDSISGASLKGMKYLEVMDLSGNHNPTTGRSISQGPRGVNSDFAMGMEVPYLTGVDVSQNSFDYFPSEFFNGYGINSFYISDQRDSDGNPSLTDWPSGIENYLQLKMLLIDGNDIRKIGTFPSGLNYLALNGNPNISVTIPSDICQRIMQNLFVLSYDVTQEGIIGCPALGIGIED